MAARAKTLNKSLALLFADSNAAYYTFLLEEVLGPLIPRDLRRELLARLRYSPREVESFEQAVRDGNELAKARVPRRWRELTASAAGAPWFQVGARAAPKRIGVTWRGGRPGDPLVDVFFNLCYRGVLERARAQLRV